MKTLNYKPLLQSLAIIAIFFFSMVFYFSPTIEGKELNQHDVMQYKGMAQEIVDFKEQTGEESLWTNSMFGGMPAYLISASYDNIVKYVFAPFQNNHEHPQMLAFMYFLCFFLALLLLDIPIWLAMLGALFYGFSSYFFIIIEAGHITKAIALSYMPVVIAGAYSAFKNKLWLGSILFSLFLALQILVNHLQITYYTMLILLIFLGFQLYETIRSKSIMKDFVKPAAFLFVGALLAIGANFGSLYMTYDYGKDSMRGQSELTQSKGDNKTQGLNKDYATAWSYGKDETFNLLIPNFKGGASNGSLTVESEFYKTLEKNQVPNPEEVIKQIPLYWGTQSSTSGPVYLGAIAVFLFIFGLLFVPGKVKWWLLTATILSIFLAWGKNFMFLTDLFLDHFPGYNKFRTVSMILIIAQFTVPLLAILALHRFFTEESARDEAFKKLKLTLYIVGGLLLILLVTVGGIYNFSSEFDSQMFPDWLLESLRNDRKSMMYSDIWRTLFFVVATFGVLTAVHFKKLKMIAGIAIIAGLTYMDMWNVNKRYLNDDDFVSKRITKKTFTKTPADLYILNDTEQDYRVLNCTVSPFNDATTSYFHKSIGGYHGAKMKRYQELIDTALINDVNVGYSITQYLQKESENFMKNNPNNQMKQADVKKMILQQVYPQFAGMFSKMNALNMLNTKYIIVDPEIEPIVNNERLGNAWFVSNITIVPNADAEINAIRTFAPRIQAIVDQRFKDQIKTNNLQVDSTSTIVLKSYTPNHIEYTSNNANDGIGIFSEIYYDKGWNAYIDGKLVPHFRANYVLRALQIPAGTHAIDFKFEPKMYKIGNTISLASSVLLIIMVCGILFLEIKKKLASNS